MSNILNEFPKPTFSDWKNQLIKDLKGESEDTLMFKDNLEEFEYPCYQHSDTPLKGNRTINDNSDYRISSKTNNNWLNFGTIIVDKGEKEANKKALNLLVLGADALRFILPSSSIEVSSLLNEIQLEYIETTIVIQSIEQYSVINQFLTDKNRKHVSIEIDLLSNSDFKSRLKELETSKCHVTFAVSGYELQQRGATTWQEVGFCLATAHEYILQLAEAGYALNEACSAITFNIGAGSNYFYEIAKLKVLAETWQQILYSYDENQINNSKVIGIVGFMNKSIKDPYTNLLRQTTEAMSLISGGSHGLVVQPYNIHSKTGATDLAERMALNIPTILKEESYLHAVIDPLAGSYTINQLCDLIAIKSWDYFKELEKLSGISSPEAQEKLKNDVISKAKERVLRINDKSDVIIGVNIFKNSKEENNEWVEFPNYLDIPQLILENQYQEVTV